MTEGAPLKMRRASLLIREEAMDTPLNRIFCVIAAAVTLAITAAACLSGGWGVLAAAAVCSAALVVIALLIRRAPEPRFIAGMAIVIVVTLIPRAAAIIAYPVVTDPVHDFGTYYRVAECLANGSELVKNSGHLFPHIFFFASALSVPFSVFGASVAAYQICGLVLSTVTAVLLYMTVRLLRGGRAAMLAALLFALSPAAVLYAPLCCGEHLAMALLTLGMYIIARISKKHPQHVWSAVLWGALLGAVLLALELVRPVAIVPVIALVLAWCAVRKGKGKLPFARAGALLLALAAVFVGGREAALCGAEAVLEKPVAHSSTSFTLLVGSNAASSGSWNEEDSEFFRAAVADYDYKSGDAVVRREVLSRYRALGAVGTARLFAVKSAHTWGGQSSVLDYLVQYSAGDNALLRGRFFSLTSFLCRGYGVALVLLAAVAAVRGFKNGCPAPVMTAMLAVLGYVCMFMLSEAAGRYSLIALPLLGIFVPGGFFVNISLDKRRQ